MKFDCSVNVIEDNGKVLKLKALILPLLLQLLFSRLYGTANTMLLSNFSATAVSAMSISNQITGICTNLLNMVQGGTVIVTSVLLGAKNYEKAKTVCGTGFYCLTGIAGAFAVLLFLFAHIFVGYMNLTGEAFSMAVTYLKVFSPFLLVQAFMVYFNKLLICNGYAKATMIVGVIWNIINVSLCYSSLYLGIADFLPPMWRVALSVGIAQTIGLILSFTLFLKNKCPFKPRFKLSVSVQVFKFGVPGGMMLFMYSIAQTITTSFVAQMGTTVINTKVFISDIVSYIYMLGYAIAEATSVFMGRYKGAAQLHKSKILYRQNLTLAMCSNLFFSLIVLTLHRWLLGFYTNDTNIINSATIIFVLDIFVQLCRAVNNVSENSLNPNGDVRTTFTASVISCFLGSVAISYLLCVRLGLGLVGLWVAFIIDESFKAIVYILRWRSNKWQKIKI